MNEDQEAQRLADRFIQAPDEIQELMLDEKLTQTVEGLALKHQLNPAQTDTLLEEIGLILLSSTKLENFKERLIMKLRLPQPRVTTLAAEIDKAIFSPVHHLLLPKTATEPISSTIPTQGTPSLADQVAQFQARKKQREEEQQKITSPSTSTKINPTEMPH